MNLLVSLAWAQEAATNAPQGGPAGGAMTGQLLMIGLMFAVMYFLIFRPANKRQKAHQSYVSTLKRGDSVLTSSGIFGTIEGITDKWVTLEIAPNTSIRVVKSYIVGPATQDEAKK